jgi:electron transfer flavoprotein beta subunit
MLRIIVCIKQVPETREAQLDPVTFTIKREGVKAIITPFDLYALEEALRVKETQGGEVAALSMGPPQAEENISRLMERKIIGLEASP